MKIDINKYDRIYKLEKKSSDCSVSCKDNCKTSCDGSCGDALAKKSDCDLGLGSGSCDECCEECFVHKEIITRVETAIPNDDYTASLSELFKTLGDPTRLKILLCLIKSEMCVCDLQQLLKREQSAISHQLRLLRAMNLVKTTRKGKSIFYSICDKRLVKILKTTISQ
ncbi:MAG: metalloregulator ArsR/SmtB family transcription factor [Oscillospiraceae bacterium]